MSSKQRRRSTTRSGASFSQSTINHVWSKARYHPSAGYARDVCGATIRRDQYGMQSTHGWEIDHIQPVSERGSDSLGNLQPLHWRNNLSKGDSWVTLPHCTVTALRGGFIRAKV